MLASFGGVGRDFQRVLEGEIDYEVSGADLYIEPDTTHALGVVQADMLHMRSRGAPRWPSIPTIARSRCTPATRRCAKWRCCTTSSSPCCQAPLHPRGTRSWC